MSSSSFNLIIIQKAVEGRCSVKKVNSPLCEAEAYSMHDRIYHLIPSLQFGKRMEVLVRRS